MSQKEKRDTHEISSIAPVGKNQINTMDSEGEDTGVVTSTVKKTKEICDKTSKNLDVIEAELASHASDAKWKQLYDEEFNRQYTTIRGMFAMGQIKGEFDDNYVKHATLLQMKKDGILQNAINWVEVAGKVDAGNVIQKAYCVPNCVKKHKHNFMYDYSKTYKDPIYQRPGECHEINQAVCMKQGTPINLDSSIPIKKDFVDKEFNFNYEVLDPKASYKFNQTNESYFFPLKKTKQANNNLTQYNFLTTKTINLFDKHIEKADLFAQQFHFHSPAEHSIDGKIMDLEMHIVHMIDAKIDPTKIGSDNPEAAQFFAGVLGFIFKVETDEYFNSRKAKNPKILFHDQFLKALIDEEMHK